MIPDQKPNQKPIYSMKNCPICQTVWSSNFIDRRITEYDDKFLAEIKQLRQALINLYDACISADEEYELSERITGEMLDAAQDAIEKRKAK